METVRYFFVALFASFVRAPIWWYGHGLLFVVKTLFAWATGYAKTMALGVWMKNLFVPMFGMYDWQSRMISFFMRVFQILFRTFMLFVWSLLLLFLFALYVALPIFTVTFFFYHLIGLITLYV